MKLTYEQKLEIYRERKEEFYSWSMLTLKWNCSRSVLDYMIKLMDCHGVEIVKHKYTDYPNQYKKEAINRVLIDDESIREVSIQLGLSNIGTREFSSSAEHTKSRCGLLAAFLWFSTKNCVRNL